MAWVGVAMCALTTLITFLISIRNFNRINPYSVEFCDLYLLEHMLPDGHPFEFMYKGLPRIRLFPRLFWPCIATFSCAGLTFAFAILAVVLSVSGILESVTAGTIFMLASEGSALLIDSCFLGIPTIQNKVCYKRMTKGGLGYNIREEIERKWPGFYKKG